MVRKPRCVISGAAMLGNSTLSRRWSRGGSLRAELRYVVSAPPEGGRNPPCLGNLIGFCAVNFDVYLCVLASSECSRTNGPKRLVCLFLLSPLAVICAIACCGGVRAGQQMTHSGRGVGSLMPQMFTPPPEPFRRFDRSPTPLNCSLRAPSLPSRTRGPQEEIGETVGKQTSAAQKYAGPVKNVSL